MKLSSKNQLNDFKDKVNKFFYNLPEEIPRIPSDKIPPKSKYSLPSGAFGETYLSDDKTHAIKTLYLNRNISDSTIASLNNEIVNYHYISTLCPKYFCKFIGYNYNEEQFRVVIVMENCGMDLFDFLTRNEINDVTQLKSVFYKVLEAMNCLHSNGYAHLDIKPENIVIHKNDVKFIDAGSLTKIKLGGDKIHVYGSPGYMAPEILKQSMISNDNNLKKMDVYSFGYMCKEYLTHKEIETIFRGDAIYKKMLDIDPEKRPSVSKIMAHINDESSSENTQPNKTTNRKRKRRSRSMRPSRSTKPSRSTRSSK